MGWFNKKQQPDIVSEITAEFNQALKQLSVNTTPPNDATVRTRLANAISGGYDFSDTLHNVYLDYGYPQALDFYQFWNMYRRFGIARNVAELPVDTGWMSEPTIEELEGAEFERLVERVKFWNRLKAIDTRQRVGRYAGTFMRVRDGLKPDQPIAGKGNGEPFLMSMVPLYEGQLRVLEIDNVPESENYGLPTMYQFVGGQAGSRNEKARDTFNIHPDRIVIAAEDADNGGIYGISSLEAPYNSLMDLRKIIGAGGEGFYKNASQSVIFNLTDAASAKQNAALLETFNEGYDDFAHNRMRRALWTPGLDPTTLDSNLADPQGFFDAALADVAAASKIPATILIGKQTGRLASNEDSRHYLSIINSRRENYQTDLIKDHIDWLMEWGVIETVKYTVEWDDLLALSDNEKMDNANKMADTNSKQFNSGGDVPFNGNEIREAAGFEPELTVEPGGEIEGDE